MRGAIFTLLASLLFVLATANPLKEASGSLLQRDANAEPLQDRDINAAAKEQTGRHQHCDGWP